ncbi:hypothetical protein PO909_027484, partial [Leuciscus waleckii]
MFCTFIFFCFWPLVDGVMRVSVTEGDSIILHTNVTDIHRNIHHIEWRFGPDSTLIADWFTEIIYHEQMFRDRIQMDSQTGSLTIRNIRTTDSGLYQLDIIYTPFRHSTVFFNVTAYDEMKSVSVTEGDSVTLHTDVSITHIHDIRYIQWCFDPKNTLVDIRFDKGTPEIRYYHDELFRDRLWIDNQTGSLAIRNITTMDSGLYDLRIIKLEKSLAVLFNFTVYGVLPIPVITNSACSSSSSSQNCSLLCSVL